MVFYLLLSLQSPDSLDDTRVMKLLILLSIIIETLVGSSVQVLEHVVLFLVAAAGLRPRVGVCNSMGHFVLLLIVEGQLTLADKLAVYNKLLLAIGRWVLSPAAVLVIAHFCA